MDIVTEGKSPLTETTLLAFRHGRTDPTWSFVAGDFWRATYTPDGPATLRIGAALSPSPSFEGFGPGASWLVARAHEFLGHSDELPAINAVHDSVAVAQRRFGHLRLGRSSSPYHELLVAVLAVAKNHQHFQLSLIVLQHHVRIQVQPRYSVELNDFRYHGLLASRLCRTIDIASRSTDLSNLFCIFASVGYKDTGR